MHSAHKKKHKSAGFSIHKKHKSSTRMPSRKSSAKILRPESKSLITIFVVAAAFFVLCYQQFYVRHFGPGDLKNLTKCSTIPREFKFEVTNDYYVLRNFIMGSEKFKCEDGVTFATTVLPKHVLLLEETVSKFDGPFSIAIYSSGENFYDLLENINYLRSCKSKRFRKMVTFHLILDRRRMPKLVSGLLLTKAFTDFSNCFGTPPKLRDLESSNYPINLAKKVAKEASQTHFVLNADFHLLPSKGIGSKFLFMLRHNPEYVWKYQPAIFVLPIFKVTKGSFVPNTKSDLKKLIDDKKAEAVLKNNCFGCDAIDIKKWLSNDLSDGYVGVFSFEKKMINLKSAYIGSRNDSKDEKSVHWNQETTGFIVSHQHPIVSDYHIMLLNNAFAIEKSERNALKMNDDSANLTGYF